ncbi:hypothetical protein [Pseudomonas sp. Pseusp3]|uniref:hypothetical protein n=1 Tax=unclassified Pseudomonas TaxID=196821 RepID=UPI0039AF3622
MTTGLKAATAVTSPWEQATLFINGKQVEWGVELVLRRGQENEVTVEAPSAIAREINLGLADNGGLETVASPEFGAWVAPVNGKFIWKITPHAGKSGRITLMFFSREVLVPWEHRSLVISRNLADEAVVKIDGVDVSNSEVPYLKNSKRTITLTPKPGSPLDGAKVSLRWVRGDGVVVQDLNVNPDLNQDTTVYRWEVTSSSEKHGTFELGLAVAGLDAMLSLPISRKIIARYFLDNKEISGFQTIVPDHSYSLRVEVSAGVSRIYVENSPGEFDFNPPLERQFVASGGRVDWTFVSRAVRDVQETVFFDYSPVYSAREKVEFVSRPN